MTTDAEWFEQHRAYLETPGWRAKRDAVMARDKKACQANLDGCTRTAEQVHHLTYRHWRNEPLFDLVAVCGNCHVVITRLERQDHAEEMLAAYGRGQAAEDAQRISHLKRVLAKYDPRRLDDQQLAAYRHLSDELDRLELRSELRALAPKGNP
jgi:hypothetical protein